MGAGAVGGAAGRSATPAGTAGDVSGGADSLVNGGSLLDANVNIHANADAAAPVDGAVAANGNVAAPIDASVAANVGSDNAIAESVAQQEVNVNQHLDDVTANATAAARTPASTSSRTADRADPMSATLIRAGRHEPAARPPRAFARAEGVELLGEVNGSGYKERRGARPSCRRPDGPAGAADVRAARGGRRRARRSRRSPTRCPSSSAARFDDEHVAALAEKLADQGLLAGSEEQRAAAESTRCSRCAGRSSSPTRR